MGIQQMKFSAVFTFIACSVLAAGQTIPKPVKAPAPPSPPSPPQVPNPGQPGAPVPTKNESTVKPPKPTATASPTRPTGPTRVPQETPKAIEQEAQKQVVDDIIKFLEKKQ